MATTSNTLSGINGSKTNFPFTFPYQNQSDLKVELIHTTHGSTTLDNSKFTFADATTISLSSGSGTNWQETSGAPKSGVTGTVYRATDSSKLAATFYPGSAIRSSDLNDNYTQNLYVTQETENDADSALSNSRVLESGSYVSAITKATTAVTTSATASTNASSAVTTANAADTKADTAISNAASAVTTANSASTAATNATNTANTASSNATSAISTANGADTKSDTAVATANTASTNATNAVSTANTASTNATNAVSTANTASTNATNAVNTANAASASVAAAVLYTPKANKAALVATEPSADGYYEVADSSDLVNATWTTNSVGYTLSGIPGTFQGSAGLTVRLSYTHSSKTYAWASYFANDPEERYISDTRTFGSTVTYVVKVATKTAQHRYNGSGHSSGFTIDAQQAPFLELNPGMTYKFDQADSSNSGHPLVFYQESDKTTGYSTGVTTNGTPGSAGAYTQIVTSDTNPTILHYQCSAHSLMGNCMQMNTAFDRTAHQVIDAGNFDTSSSTAALSNTYDGGDFDS